MSYQCPHCNKQLVSLDFIEGSRLAKCRHCGAEVGMDEIVDPEGERESTQDNLSSASTDNTPPNTANFQMRDTENGQLQLYLPQLGLNILSVFMVIIPLIMIMIPGYFYYSKLQSPDGVALSYSLFMFCFCLFIVWFMILFLNYAFRTETLIVDDHKLYLTEHNFISVPQLTKSSREYDLGEIQQIQFSSSSKDDDDSKIYVRLSGNSDEFFKSETTEGKKWLAQYLNNILTNTRAYQ